MKYSDGYKRPIPTIINLVLFFTGILLLSKAVLTMNLGLAYATWSGVGIILSSILGLYLFGEKLNKINILGIVIVIIGVMIMNFL